MFHIPEQLPKSVKSLESPRPLVSDEREFAKELGVPLRVVQEASELFLAHSEGESGSPAAGGALRLGHISRSRAGELLGLDTGDSGVDVTFGEFAFLFYSNGFSADVMLTPRSRHVREVATFHGVGLNDMDRYKQAFDRADENKSGFIDVEEFRRAISRLVKVPAGLELPTKRVQMLWQEADTDGTGKVDLEKFIVFYSKYFDVSDGADPLEALYSRPRRNSSAMFGIDA